MTRGRLEAFSDGVLAIVITIMVLEMSAPHRASWAALAKLWPVFLSYVLSFVYVGIYWNNHHHLLKATPRVNGTIMWANLHLLFWLTLIPFVTDWMGENDFATAPTMLYGVVLLFAGFAYWILQAQILALVPDTSILRQEFRRDLKGRLSLLFHFAGVVVATFSASLAFVIYCLVAVMWIVPDRRIERALIQEADRLAE